MAKHKTLQMGLEELLSPEVNAMAKLYLDSVLQVSCSAGIPPSVWRTVPDHTTAQQRMRPNLNSWGTPVQTETQEGNRDE